LQQKERKGGKKKGKDRKIKRPEKSVAALIGRCQEKEGDALHFSFFQVRERTAVI